MRGGAVHVRRDAAEHGGERLSTNNAVGGVDARLSDMPRLHRGLPLMRRVKAIFWWRYVYAENLLPAAEIIRAMPADDADGLSTAAPGGNDRDDGAPEECGAGIARSEVHVPTNHRQWIIAHYTLSETYSP